MPALIAPRAAVHTSFLAAMGEFAAEGRGGPSDHTGIGIEMCEADWSHPMGFARCVAWLVALAVAPRWASIRRW